MPGGDTGGDGSSFTDQSIMKEFHLYPNPVTDFLNFSNIEENSNIHIYSITGSLLIDADISSGSVNLIDLPSGSYWVVVTNKNNTYRQMIIKK